MQPDLLKKEASIIILKYDDPIKAYLFQHINISEAYV